MWLLSSITYLISYLIFDEIQQSWPQQIRSPQEKKNSRRRFARRNEDWSLKRESCTMNKHVFLLWTLIKISNQKPHITATLDSEFSCQQCDPIDRHWPFENLNLRRKFSKRRTQHTTSTTEYVRLLWARRRRTSRRNPRVLQRVNSSNISTNDDHKLTVRLPESHCCQQQASDFANLVHSHSTSEVATLGGKVPY